MKFPDAAQAATAALAHLAVGAAFAAWLACRLHTRRPLDAWDHLAGVALTFFGPLAALAVAYDITQHGLSRRRVRS